MTSNLPPHPLSATGSTVPPELVLEIAAWLDYQPFHYWGPGFLLLLMSTFLAIRPLIAQGASTPSRRTLSDTRCFLVVALLCLLAFRWPTFLYLKAIDFNDERFLIATARKFLVEPVPWLSADNTTSGPLNSYVLLLPALFGVPIDYPSVRVVGFLLLACLLVFSFLTVRTLCSDFVGRIAILPSLILLGVTQSLFFDYCTEMLSITLLAIAVYLLARATRHGPRRIPAYAIGLCLGAVPFAKLQAGPVAFLVYIFALVLLVHRGADSPSKSPSMPNPTSSRLSASLWLTAGAVTAPIALTWIVYANSALVDAWRSYILTPLFLSSNPLSPRSLASLLAGTQGFNGYVVTTLLLAILSVAGRRWWRVKSPTGGRNNAWILAAVIYLGAAIYVIRKGGNPWPHYLLFLVHPAILLTGLIIDRAIGTPAAFCARRRVALIALSAAAVLAATGSMRTWTYAEGRITESIRTRIDAVSALILSLVGGDRHFTVWGYMPGYYVVSGLYPSTRDAMTQFQIQSNPLRPYYIERYLKDFRASSPNVFVVATGKGNHNYFWDTDPSYEAVPELRQIIRQDFVLAYDVERCGTPEAQIFVRRSRMMELGLTEEKLNNEKLCFQ